MSKKILGRSRRAGGFKTLGGLGSISVEENDPWLKQECKRGHIWNRSRFNRRCCRCGREEEKNPSTGAWEHF